MDSSHAYYVGCITGTSVDGLDLALVRMPRDGQGQGDDIDIITATTIDLPPPLQLELLQLGQPGTNEIDRLGRADAQLGEFIGQAVLDFLDTADVSAAQIHAIGSHGQTVRHRPDGSHAFTLQIGDANRIAEQTGITTVADFRRRDMAAGGQGAPLVPRFHAALFGNLDSTALLNIGGLANLTLLQPDTAALGFDTGPGNGLLDAWINLHQQKSYDHDGAWSVTGTANNELCARLLSDAYFARTPPKSTGKEYFNLAWLQQQLAEHQGANPAPTAVDVQATLVQLTVQSIAEALQRIAPTCSRILVCGGGRLNAHLMARLAAASEASVAATESVGVDGDSLEAAAFAWLANRTMAGLTGNLASVTGAAGERVLGSIFPG